MMEYMDIVNTIRSGAEVKSTDVSGIQLFMLLRDKVVKNLEVSEVGIFEFNFVPVNEDEMDARPLRLNKVNCRNFSQAGDYIKFLVRQYKHGEKSIYVAIEDETFQLYIEELESNE